MLGKLIKYEFKATGKIFLLFYAGLLLMAVINMLLMPWGPVNSLTMTATDLPIEGTGVLDFVKNIAQSAIFIMYIVVVIAVGIVTLVAVILRFYKMLGDEGYLMFTLPVSTSAQIFSKLITATVWFICSTAVIILSALIVIGRVDYFGYIAEGIRELSSMGLHPGAWFVLTIVIVLLSMIVCALEFYLALTLGTHITKNRAGGSIIGYIIVYAATQIISTLAMIPLVFSLNSIDSNINMSVTEMEFRIMTSVSIYSILILLVFGLASYFITHYLLKNKLNLG